MMKLCAVALACLLTVPSALAQGNGNTPSGFIPLPVAFAQTLPLPGEDAGPQFDAARATNLILRGDGTFEETLAELLALAASPEYAGNAIRVQAVSGIGLRWALRAPTEWAGNAAEVAQLLSAHASHGGIMFAEMVQTYDMLVWHLPSDSLPPLRDQIVEAYTLRVENPCDGCADDPFAFIISPESFRDSMRARVQMEADAHRAAVVTIAEWADEN